MNHLSLPSSLNCKSFDLPLSQCVESCFYGKKDLCYSLPKNNIHEIYNKRKQKLTNNLDFLNSDDFVNDFTIELKINCISYFRFFSSGDIANIEQFIKIMKVIEKSKNIKFWLPTHNQNILYEYFDIMKLKKPKNVNILLSLPIIDFKTPEFMKIWAKKHRIGLSNVTDDLKKSNCIKSITHSKCGNCFKCFKSKKIVYLLHGIRPKKIWSLIK